MNHSGSANRPQPDHITATQHPAIYRAAYGCVQGGRGRRREGKAAKKKTESHIKKHKGRRVMAGRTGVMAVSKDEGRKVEQEGQE